MQSLRVIMLCRYYEYMLLYNRRVNESNVSNKKLQYNNNLYKLINYSNNYVLVDLDRLTRR